MIEITSLSIPRLGKTDLIISLDDIIKAEQRQEEIAFINKVTAFELMSVFIKAGSKLRELNAQVMHEYVQARKVAEKRKAVVMLEIAPKVLQEKGLTNAKSPMGSADLRESVLALDEEYLNIMEKVDLLEATYALLRGKLKSFEESYQAVKKIFSSDDNDYLDNGHNLRTGEVHEGLGKTRY